MLAAVHSTTSLLGRVRKKWFKSIKLAAISFYLKQNYFFGPFSFLCHTCSVRPLSVILFLIIFYHHSLSLTPSLWLMLWVVSEHHHEFLVAYERLQYSSSPLTLLRYFAKQLLFTAYALWEVSEVHQVGWCEFWVITNQSYCREFEGRKT